MERKGNLSKYLDKLIKTWKCTVFVNISQICLRNLLTNTLYEYKIQKYYL